ncbi:hypothetical protein [Spirillospora sp. NPDC029432]|uniref:hypothetical protein n=1 Tax=Spirillospora sp. NPDC029432 TaxID=3154599 RepID=UPI003452DD2C
MGECFGVVAAAVGDEVLDVLVGGVGQLAEVFGEEISLWVVAMGDVPLGGFDAGGEQELVGHDAPGVEAPVDGIPEKPDVLDLAVFGDQDRSDLACPLILEKKMEPISVDDDSNVASGGRRASWP